MTYEVQQTRWDRIIRRVSGSIGPGSRVSETISELFPVLDVERVPGELLVLGGTKLMVAGVVQPAVVGEAAKVQLFNPIDSGTLVIPTTILLHTDTSQFLFFGLVGLALANRPTNPNTRDSRLGVLNRAVGEARIESTVPVIPTIARVFVVADTNVTLTDPNGLAVLAPNSGLQFTGTGLNRAVAATFFWRERPAQESELSL